MVSDLEMIHTNVLTSRTWCHRVEPFIYEYIPYAKTCRFLSSLTQKSTAKSRDFYACHVKAINIMFWDSESAMEETFIEIFTSFTSLQNVALWLPWEGRRPAISRDTAIKWNTVGVSFRPRRFSCHLQYFFAVGDTPQQPDFGGAFFSRLTHLDIVDDAGIWSSWRGLESLPCLTHLSFSEDVEFVFQYYSDSPAKAFIHRMLKDCPTLEIVLFFASKGTVEDGTTRLEHTFSSEPDPRCVVLDPSNIYEDWHSPFLGKVDSWAEAEEIVRKQRQARAMRQKLSMDAA